jgi:hypothetical protein
MRVPCVQFAVRPEPHSPQLKAEQTVGDLVRRTANQVHKKHTVNLDKTTQQKIILLMLVAVSARSVMQRCAHRGAVRCAALTGCSSNACWRLTHAPAHRRVIIAGQRDAERGGGLARAAQVQRAHGAPGDQGVSSGEGGANALT